MKSIIAKIFVTFPAKYFLSNENSGFSQDIHDVGEVKLCLIYIFCTQIQEVLLVSREIYQRNRIGKIQ